MSDNETSNKNLLDEVGFKNGAGLEQWETILQGKLGMKISDLQQAICEWLKKNSEEVSLDMTNIAPEGDYGRLIEDNDGMAQFLQTEASKPEHWSLLDVRLNNNMMQFGFSCKVVDDGESLRGFVYVSSGGKIRHAFAQNRS